MPDVNDKKFPYTAKGKKAAKKEEMMMAKKDMPMKSVREMKMEQMKKRMKS